MTSRIARTARSRYNDTAGGRCDQNLDSSIKMPDLHNAVQAIEHGVYILEGSDAIKRYGSDPNPAHAPPSVHKRTTIESIFMRS